MLESIKGTTYEAKLPLQLNMMTVRCRFFWIKLYVFQLNLADVAEAVSYLFVGFVLVLYKHGLDLQASSQVLYINFKAVLDVVGQNHFISFTKKFVILNRCFEGHLFFLVHQVDDYLVFRQNRHKHRAPKIVSMSNFAKVVHNLAVLHAFFVPYHSLREDFLPQIRAHFGLPSCN